MGCGPENGPALDWRDYPAHLEVVKQRLRTKPAGDFAAWILQHYGYEAGYRLPFVDEADINILLLEWIGVSQDVFAAEHADMLEKQNGGG